MSGNQVFSGKETTKKITLENKSYKAIYHRTWNAIMQKEGQMWLRQVDESRNQEERGKCKNHIPGIWTFLTIKANNWCEKAHENKWHSETARTSAEGWGRTASIRTVHGVHSGSLLPTQLLLLGRDMLTWPKWVALGDVNSFSTCPNTPDNQTAKRENKKAVFPERQQKMYLQMEP